MFHELLSHFKFLTVVTFSILLSSQTLAQTTVSAVKQISVGQKNQVPSGASGSPSIASNGQKLIYNSDASNIVDADTNSSRDIFLTDIVTGLNSRLSINNQAIEANDDSFNPAVSPVAPDGFFAAAFESDATNLSAFADTLGKRDIFIRLPVQNFTEIVSIAPGPVFANGNSRNASVTVLQAPRKVLIAFESDASNLVADDTNSMTDIFLASSIVPTNLSTESFAANLKVIKISSGISGQSNGNSEKPVISADGKFIVFTSSATNLLTSVNSSSKQIYLYNIAKNTLELISKDVAGLAGNANSYAASINYNGRLIAYLTEASSIDSDASGSKIAAMLYDRVSGLTSRLNVNSSGSKGNGKALNVSISANGRYVSLSDTSSNLTENDSNGIADIFVKDLLLNQIAKASITSTGAQTNGASDLSTLSGSNYSASSAKIVFRSFATNFSPDNPSSGSDIFSSDASLTLRTLEKKADIVVPADIIQLKQRANFQFESFLSNAALSTRAKAIKINYDLRVNKIGSKNSSDQIKKISKKNQISLSRLKPGNYSSKYRAISVQGNKIVKASTFSPVQKFTVLKK